MDVVKRSVTFGTIAVALLSAVAAQSQPQTPGYISAKPDAAQRAFGRDVAGKIFSGAYTPVRQQAVLRSQQTIPGFQCPADPQIALTDIIPYPVRQGAVSWIERYVVACSPRTMRNFLMILEGDQPRPIELLPGTTNADPLLQRDALQGASAFAGAVRPKDCDTSTVVETRLTSKIERGAPWVERWTYELCGVRAELEMTFTPTPNAGTNWSATLIK